MNQSNLPLVTVAIAVYNGAATIEKCLQSALEQTYPKIEILISDDCSVDSSSEICKKYMKQNSKVVYYKNKERLGMILNYNSLLAKAKGEFFILFDQDDYRENDYIEKAVKEISSPEVELVIGNTTVMYKNQIMHINSFQKNSCGGGCILRVFNLLRRPSDFLLYGLVRTNTLRELRGWTLATSSFFRIIFGLVLRGQIKIIESSHFYAAKGAKGRPNKRGELLRLGTASTKLQSFMFGYLEMTVGYLSEIRQSKLRFRIKLSCSILVILDLLFKTVIKIFLRFINRFNLLQKPSKLRSFLIYIYHPVDQIVFFVDRENDTSDYYRKNWPLV